MTGKMIATATAIAIWLAVAEILHHWFGLSPHAAELVGIPITAALAIWVATGPDSRGTR